MKKQKATITSSEGRILQTTIINQKELDTIIKQCQEEYHIEAFTIATSDKIIIIDNIEESINVIANKTYVCELPQQNQNIIKERIKNKLAKEGYNNQDITNFLSDAMNSKMSDIDII